MRMTVVCFDERFPLMVSCRKGSITYDVQSLCRLWVTQEATQIKLTAFSHIPVTTCCETPESMSSLRLKLAWRITSSSNVSHRLLAVCTTLVAFFRYIFFLSK